MGRFKIITTHIFKKLTTTSPISRKFLVTEIKKQNLKKKVGYILGSQTYFSLLSIILM